VLSRRRYRGVTVTELVVGMALIAILFGLGAPAMGTYLQNSKLASAAAGYFAGIQLARTEAIRRNVRTEFVLTDDPVSTANLANVVAPAVAGRNWIVRAASAPGFAAVEVKAGAEGDGSSGASIVATGSATLPAVFDGRIAFNGFGGTADSASYAINITNPAAGTCAALGGPIRCRRITITPGGQILSCDPAAPAGDSRAC
jgi:type IV fimbrial biogenesis protein FimT